EFYRQSAASLANKSGYEKGQPVGVIGGGLMGLELTTACALNDVKVFLRAAHKDRQNLAMERISEALHHAAAKGTVSAETLLERVTSVEDDALLGTASVIAEACAEDNQAKIDLFKKLAESVGPETVLVTNTSSFSIGKLAEHAPNPKNFLGLHFFHPIERMPLVELIVHPGTSKAAIGRASGFAQSLGKIPLTVKDSPAFLVNRLLGSYVSEVGYLAQRQVPMNWLEDAALDFGMPMGPLTLMDEVGLDVANMVSHILHSSFGERLAPPPGLPICLKAGMIGKKTGEGLFLWDKSGKKLDFNPKIISELKLFFNTEKAETDKLIELQEAMFLPMVDEAARCLEERVVRRAREIDLCMVMGLGFPAFRGGLLRWADSIGLKAVIEKLETIYNHGGPERQVSDYLKKLADQGRGFYSRSAEES
ncbi:MAG TPA: 3-hydroxyacyl-CoA dehydrogenase NAD-binding domain-containing protein, partial [Chroococcales cyanobacterium]